MKKIKVYYNSHSNAFWLIYPEIVGYELGWNFYETENDVRGKLGRYSIPLWILKTKNFHYIGTL